MLTRAQFNALEFAESQARHGLNMMTTRQMPKRIVDQCIARGWMVDAGQCVVVGSDGFAVEPEQWRPGYCLTDDGRALLAKVRGNLCGCGYPRETCKHPEAPKGGEQP